jgi:hypothetical protein
LGKLVEMIISIYDFLIVFQSVCLGIRSSGRFNITIEICDLLINLRDLLSLVKLEV